MSVLVPRLLSFSPPDPGGVSRWVAVSPALAAVPGVGLLLRLLVERDWDTDAWLDELVDTGAPIIVHARSPGGVRLAAERGLGLHLPSWADPQACRGRIRGPLGMSCHGLADLARAAVCCDYATLSPVFAPRSKPIERPPIGLAGLRLACAESPLPVLALGGLGPEGVEACLEAGAHGVAGIGSFGDPKLLAAMAGAFR
jgi:thiamine monophosphate synthase